LYLGERSVALNAASRIGIIVEDVLAFLLPQLPTLEEIIIWGGYAGLAAIIFSETGLMVGFFLPGDSLLVTAGLFCARGEMSIGIIIPLLIMAAILGNSTGYYIGSKAGPTLYNRPQSRLFRRDRLLKTREMFEKHGGLFVVAAQFMPFARTFTPVVAGIASMPYRRFVSFNVGGAIFWITSMTLTGYYLGRMIPGIQNKIEYVIAIIVFLSVLPIIIKYIQHRTKNGTTTAEG
jgi:membrane-associated protein